MRFYRMLLLRYPASFRREYAADMRQLFAARLTQTAGPLARLGLWLDTVGEVVSNAAVVHWDMLVQDLRDNSRAGGGQRNRLRAALVMGEVMACIPS